MIPVRKIASLILLVVLLITSTGISMFTVFCQMTGESYRSAIEKHCCCQEADSMDMCCDEEVNYLQLDIESSISELQTNLSPHFFAAWIQYQVNHYSGKDLNSSKYFHYKPPLIERNIMVFVQSFLL